ncbi:uncharacterized protein LOC128985647 [Macrosteles quadrilineatus]|uniref:uncharacterized protein LOC128985647 n=1 Tax=Macrosteles quadrilineatus TaxID=74068 RepID=UPI0023E24DB5|nr:uncharacterized protein LOC128985647 [Macrosteles quadrilineatus]
MDNLRKTFDSRNRTYSDKLKFEIKALNLLTSKILSEIENRKTHKWICKTSEHNLELATVNESKNNVMTDKVYKTINRYLKALILYVNCNEEFHYTLPAIINPPMAFSLSTLCNMLWKRVQTLSKSLVESKVFPTGDSTDSEIVSVSYKSSQTETCSLVYCESCWLSTGLIKSLVHLILELQKKHNIKETHVSKAREKIKPEVYEMSQLGVMNAWTAAIRDDIEWLLSLTVTSLRKCKDMFTEHEVERTHQRRRETALQNDLELTRKQLEAEQAQCVYLREQVEGINLSLARKIEKEKTILKDMSEYRNKFKTLGKFLISIKDGCREIKEFQKYLQADAISKTLCMLRTITDFKDNIAFHIRKIDDSYAETLQRERLKSKEAQETAKERENEVVQLKTDILELLQEQQELRERLRIMAIQENKKEQELRRMQFMEKELKQVIKERQMETSTKPHDASLSEKTFGITGDPVTDMENKRYMNKQKIKILLRENTSLKTTILKLKNVKP